jgi:hypothetical protein
MVLRVIADRKQQEITTCTAGEQGAHQKNDGRWRVYQTTYTPHGYTRDQPVFVPERPHDII